MDRREQIIGAVTSCAAEEGIAGVTLRNVARRIGATTGMLMHYYENRTALLKDISLASDRSLRARIADVAGTEPGLDWLIALFEESFATNNGELPWTFWVEYWASAAKDEDLRRHSTRRAERLRREVERSIDACVEAGLFRQDLDIALAGRSVATFLNGVGVDLALELNDRGLDAARESYFELLRGFAPSRTSLPLPEPITV